MAQAAMESDNLDATLKALQAEERRELLKELLGHEQVALSIEGDERTAHLHNHLPMLEDQDLIRYEYDEAFFIERGPAFERARELVECVSEFSE